MLLNKIKELPAGLWGEDASTFDIDFFKIRHHINFFKASNDVINLILMGTLHARSTFLEAARDPDYYFEMRNMRDDFEAARPPSFWREELQDTYIERLKEFVIEWETTKNSIQYTNSKGQKVDFIKIVNFKVK